MERVFSEKQAYLSGEKKYDSLVFLNKEFLIEEKMPDGKGGFITIPTNESFLRKTIFAKGIGCVYLLFMRPDESNKIEIKVMNILTPEEFKEKLEKTN